MENFLINILLCFTLVLHHVDRVQSCSCLPPDPFQAVCGSDFAINATILYEEFVYPPGGDETNSHTEYKVRYQLDIHNVYNPSAADVDSFPSVLSSPGPSNLCGLSLEVGSTYILTGYISQNDAVLGMSLCNYHINVNGQSGSNDQAEQIMDAIDCSNPPDKSYMDLEYDIDTGVSKKSNIPAEKTTWQDGTMFRKLLGGFNRR